MSGRGVGFGRGSRKSVQNRLLILLFEVSVNAPSFIWSEATGAGKMSGVGRASGISKASGHGVSKVEIQQGIRQ